jgi:hypothetical protein
MDNKGTVKFDKVQFPDDVDTHVIKVQTQEKASGTPVEGGVEVPVLTADNHAEVLADYKDTLALAQLQLDTYAMNWRRVQLVEDPIKAAKKAVTDKLAGLTPEQLAEVTAKILSIVDNG